MSAAIFISYSSKDRQIAETICQALEARGQICWIACRDVRAGENFQEAIVRALREAKVMLLVFTSNANNSDEIKKELVLAGRHHVTVVPARVEDVIPNDAFSYELATRQWIDLFKDWEQEIEQLSRQLALILRAADKAEPAGTAKPLPIPPPHRKKGNRILIAAALMLLFLLIAGALAYLRPWAGTKPATPTIANAAPKSQTIAPVQATNPAPQAIAATVTPPSPVQTARPSAKHVATAHAEMAQTATATPAVPPPSAATPAAQPVPAHDPDETEWQTATSANTREGFAAYLRDFPAGTHLQEAQLQIASLILKMPATGANFDGTWQTSWTCANLGQYPGYTFQFSGQVRDGVYHGVRGTKGEPSSMVLDGKIESDGAAAFSGEIIVGSSLAGLGAARGTPSDFHALALFARGGGVGKRLEGRGCNLSFEKQ